MVSLLHTDSIRRALTGRAPRIVFAALAFAAALLNSPPSSPSAAGPRPLGPSADEARVLEHLATWVLEEASSAELVEAVRDHGRSFELFRDLAADRDRRVVISGLPYGDAIWRAAERWGVDPLLLASMVENESGFDAAAVSQQGALGLMQVLPETADLFRPQSDLLDPVVNLEVGARYIAVQVRQFNGDLPLALAAYNAGPGNVLRFAGIPPFAETRHYVRRVLSSYVSHLQSSWRGSGDVDWLVVES